MTGTAVQKKTHGELVQENRYLQHQLDEHEKYILALSCKKTLNNSPANQTKDQVSDFETWGGHNTWKLICKASSKKEGWMKSTKAMEIPDKGCIVQVTTQQRNPDGSWSIAEAITFVPHSAINDVWTEDNHHEELIGRKIY